MEHGIVFYVFMAGVALLLSLLAGATGYLFELLIRYEELSKTGQHVDFLSLCSKARLAALSICGFYPALLGTVFFITILSAIGSDRLTAESIYLLSLTAGSLFAFFPLKTYAILKRKFPALLDLAVDRVADKITPGNNNASTDE